MLIKDIKCAVDEEEKLWLIHKTLTLKNNNTNMILL
jgi:hypothetical protein